MDRLGSIILQKAILQTDFNTRIALSTPSEILPVYHGPAEYFQGDDMLY